MSPSSCAFLAFLGFTAGNPQGFYDHPRDQFIFKGEGVCKAAYKHAGNARPDFTVSSCKSLCLVSENCGSVSSNTFGNCFLHQVVSNLTVDNDFFGFDCWLKLQSPSNWTPDPLSDKDHIEGRVGIEAEFGGDFSLYMKDGIIERQIEFQDDMLMYENNGVLAIYAARAASVSSKENDLAVSFPLFRPDEKQRKDEFLTILHYFFRTLKTFFKNKLSTAEVLLVDVVKTYNALPETENRQLKWGFVEEHEVNKIYIRQGEYPGTTSLHITFSTPVERFIHNDMHVLYSGASPDFNVQCLRKEIVRKIKHYGPLEASMDKNKLFAENKYKNDQHAYVRATAAVIVISRIIKAFADYYQASQSPSTEPDFGAKSPHVNMENLWMTLPRAETVGLLGPLEKAYSELFVSIIEDDAIMQQIILPSMQRCNIEDVPKKYFRLARPVESPSTSSRLLPTLHVQNGMISMIMEDRFPHRFVGAGDCQLKLSENGFMEFEVRKRLMQECMNRYAEFGAGQRTFTTNAPKQLI
eukprot:GEMP01033678.1.p1 GENE.GEMP01033678.1~~GEMP01033678.1.p1  ORF type:complete len:524 (+),score=73.81 GEMP01033678.1:71-1642(+)